MEDITQYFSFPVHIAAALHKMSICDFKRMYNSIGIKRWPYHRNKNKKSTSFAGFQDFQINTSLKQKSKTIEKETLVLDFEDFCESLKTDSIEQYLCDSLFED
jgi:hypothetical protein